MELQPYEEWHSIMTKICTKEKTAARQRWIENGLMELMQKCKFEDITATDLCRYLELPRRSFYRYFNDMEDVLDSLMNHTFRIWPLPTDICPLICWKNTMISGFVKRICSAPWHTVVCTAKFPSMR